ncbi:MAG: Ig-like domain-containing protein, partial [Candidatus Marinimicrobia bacterium]|nr:Ig-like domain-containing protein [Candidatus Neomarinimicrobiota bacterium]
SIHSNAGGSTANNALLLYGEPKEDPNRRDIPGGKAMSEIMVVNLANGMRIPSIGARGECQFYYGDPNCPRTRNHVNRESNMPSELSEAGFHTNPMQNQRNMSASWNRLEAYIFYWSILDYHDIARPTVDILTGIIKNKESVIPINGAIASAGGLTDTTDTYESLFHKYSNDPDQLHNGFYFFEGLAGASQQLIVIADDYYPDTIQVTMVDNFFTFQDVGLVSTLPPYLASSTPAEGDSLFPAWDAIVINFSRPMDAPTVEAAFTSPGGVGGAFAWANGNRRLLFTPDSLDYLTQYTFSIGGTALDAYGHPFDGDGDGVGGDSLAVHFRTGPADMSPPTLVAVYPRAGLTRVELLPLIAVTFDEAIIDCTVTADKLTLTDPGGLAVSGTVEHHLVAERSVLHLFPEGTLEPATQYTTGIHPGLRDLQGNETTVTYLIRFTTGTTIEDVTSIDNFEAGVGNWWSPTTSGSSIGWASSGNTRAASQTVVNLLTTSTSSMQLNYAWDTAATDWLIREHLSGGTPRSVQFNSSYVMQAYVFGDGSGNQVRFCVDDNNITGATNDHEVSPWYTIDWIGWKLVSWDMTNDGTGTWIGDGNLDGTMRFDSFQLTYVPGAAPSGTLYFDDLRIVQYVPLATETASQLPSDYVLYANYPNPFNPATTIEFALPQRDQVRITVYDLLGRAVRNLENATLDPGRHSIIWDGRDDHGRQVAAGMYIYRLVTPSASLARKMLLLK